VRTVRAQTGPRSSCAGRLYAEGVVCVQRTRVCAKKSLLFVVGWSGSLLQSLGCAVLLRGSLSATLMTAPTCIGCCPNTWHVDKARFSG